MSCLFDSISNFVNTDGNTVRQLICNYLEGNNPIIEGVPTSTILNSEDSQYIQKMRNSSQWGGGIEIQAACNIWKLRIVVYNIEAGKEASAIEFLPLTTQPIHTIRLTWNGEHYTAG